MVHPLLMAYQHQQPGNAVKRSTLVLNLLLGACLSTTPTEVRPGEEFTLGPNQSVHVVDTDLTIGFRRVVTDSRCPIDVLCVTEGSAGVELNVFGRSADNPVRLETREGFDSWTDGTYTIELLELEPNPSSSQQIDPEDYRVRLVVRLVQQ